MSGQPGQAPRHWAVRFTCHCGRLLRGVLLFGLALGVVGVIGAGALAWRLGRGPLPVSWLLPRLERALSGPDLKVTIGGASLAWEGFAGGSEQPVVIRLEAVQLLDRAGAPVALLPREEISLAFAPLLLGRLEPRTVLLQGVRFSAARDAGGHLSLLPDRSGQAVAADAPAALAAGFAALAVPPGAAGAWPALRALRLLRITDGSLHVDDKALGLRWAADGVTLTLTRAAAGGAVADSGFTLASGGVSVPVALHASLAAGSVRADVTARVGPVMPARLAALAPVLAPLKALDAPVTLTVRGHLGATLQPEDVKAKAEVGAGRLVFEQGSVPLFGATVEASGSPENAVVKLDKATIAPAPDGPQTTLGGTVAIRRADGAFTARIETSFDTFAFADLPALWPVGVGNPHLRPWIIENITGGTGTDGRISLTLTGRDDFTGMKVTALGGGFAGHDLTVRWLKSLPPLEHGEATLTFLSPQALDIAVTAAKEGGGKGGGVVVRKGLLHITGLDVHDQFLALNGDLAGPVADLYALLNDPALRLVSRSPLTIEHPSGQASGQLTAYLPLNHDLKMSQVTIATQGTLSNLHLGAVVLGHDLDEGHLAFSADDHGMRLEGTAKLGGIPAKLSVGLDFRPGGPAQVVERVRASGEASGAQLATLGLPAGGALSGTVAFEASEQVRRDARNDVTLLADLRNAALSVQKLGYGKPAGEAARAEIHLVLRHDEVLAVPVLRLEGTELHVSASMRFAGGKPASASLEQVVLGPRNDFHGTLEFPSRPGAPWVARLAGRSLDAEAEFGHHAGGGTTKPPAARPPAAEAAGPPWRAEVNLAQVALGGPNRLLYGVRGSAAGDGSRITSATLTGRTGAAAGKGDVSVRIVLGAATRSLAVTAADAGALLRALDVADGVDGGQLTISGHYQDGKAGKPLVGQAEITDFRVRNAPVLAKLLQAVTLYGLVDLLQGPGLGFSHLIVPFTKTGEVLDIAQARAFSASLGLTAKGRIDFGTGRLDIDGTVVPAYFFNSLLGKIPLVGRLFSPEKGGGLVAADYSLRGPLNDPQVIVNPLSVLTPGFLRGLFGIFDEAPAPAPGPGAPPGAGGPAQGGG